jgi:hypothetical protein
MNLLRFVASVTLGLGVVAVGCASTDDAVECRAGADCVSGICGSDGRCVTPSTGDAGTTTATGTGGKGEGGSGAGGSGAGGQSAGGSGAGGVVGCAPNKDGVITRAEVPLAAGLHATFRTAKNVTWDTAGQTNGDGSRTWDLSKDLDGDQSLLVETKAVDGQWFADKYPGATYYSYLTPDAFLGDMVGVFRVTGDALELLGVASPTDGMTKTEEVYKPAAALLKFPVKEGATWSTDAQVAGWLKGVDYSLVPYPESYESTVDAHGTLTTPFGSFEVLRVKTKLSRLAFGVTTVVRSYMFVTECFGTVATVTSQSNETEDEFTSAAEIRRLAP